ncbi:MAG: hypothetical protein ACLU30_09375 [Odoribacter splanchnicus]
MFKQINHSFAAKLNIYLISSAFLLWGIGFCLFYHYSSRAIEHQAYLKIDESAEKINLKVTRLLRTIEKIPENLSWIIPSYVTHADSIYAITRQVVLNNYEIFGCAIAFEPYYFPDKGYYFAPYSYMSGDSVVTTQIDPKYDYYQKIGTDLKRKECLPLESSLPRAFVQRYPDLHLFGTAPGPPK